jgi:hypothetical protein
MTTPPSSGETLKRPRSPSLDLTLVLPTNEKKVKTKGGVPENKLLSLQRKVFNKLRSPSTTPDTMLQNGRPSGVFATEYILQTHLNRSSKKDKTTT